MKKINSFSIRSFFKFSFLFILIGIISFYSYPEHYKYQNLREFFFKGTEVIEVIIPIALFFFGLTVFTIILKKFFINNPINKKNLINNVSSLDNINSKFILYILVFIILLALPINFFAFYNGIGLTGSTPPNLPFKLTGIIVYFTKFLIPLLLGFFYIQKKNFFLLNFLLVTIYLLFINATTSSKGPLTIFFVIIIFYHFMNKNYLYVFFSIIVICIGFEVATFFRTITMQVQDGFSIAANTNYNIFETFIIFLNDFQNIEILKLLDNVTSRFLSFKGLVLSTVVDPNNFGGAFNVFLHTIDIRLGNLDGQLLQQEVIGYIPPTGHYNSPSDFFSFLIWSTNISFFYYFLFIIYAYLYLVIQENIIIRIGEKYSISSIYLKTIIYLMTLGFISGPSYHILNNIFILLLLFSIIPKIRLIDNLLNLTNFKSK